MPCYNSAIYIKSCLNSIFDQSYENFELICINDGSTDKTLDILQNYAKKYNNLKIINIPRSNAGKARNIGLKQAYEHKVDYIYICDSDDILDSKLLEKSLKIALKYKVDIVGFNSLYFDDFNKSKRKDILITSKIYNHKSNPHNICYSINPPPWNKFYKASFLKKNDLWFDEILFSNDLSFNALSLLKAGSIYCIDEILYFYRKNNKGLASKKINNDIIVNALFSFYNQAKKLKYFEDIKISVFSYIVINYIYFFKNYKFDLKIEKNLKSYENIKNLFLSSEFDILNKNNLNNKNFEWFSLIKDMPTEQISSYKHKKIIVCLTSWPKRIKYVSLVINNLLNQSLKADLINLYLSKNEFNGFDSLPSKLIKLEKENKVNIIFVEDNLYPHKKYFYAFKEYPNDLIITIDDDLIYPYDMIEELVKNYYKYPKAIIANRTHYMIFKNDEIKYGDFLNTQDILINTPSMHLLATAGGGCLLNPRLFDSIVDLMLDENNIKKYALFQDDIWLKVCQIVANIPVIQNNHPQILKYLPGSQKYGLYNIMNKNNNFYENDRAFLESIKFFNSFYKENIFMKNISNETYKNTWLNQNDIINHYKKEIQNYKKELNKSKQTIKKIKNGISWKIGRFFTFIPRKISNIFNH